ncbi:MAG: hypothetical protein QOI99_1967 [Actinomycetota bacterium]|jgi:V8-like Glu-specific endopeptidase|nr:hypothetical protein [Actinomycetota bacterium]
MSPEGHRPVRNTDPVSTVPSSMVESSLESFVAPAPRPIEPVVLPYYRPPRRPNRPAAELFNEAFVPEGFTPGAAGDDVGDGDGFVRDAAEGSFGETMLLEAVIGNDDRVRVDDSLLRTNPWRQICALRIRSRSGAGYVGTAWFIGPRVLATAGHCVFMHKEGGWAEEIVVIPGKFGATEPFGRVTARTFASVDGWIADPTARDFDYGVIILDDPALGTRLGNFEVEAAPDGELGAATARVSGYPADRDRAEFQYFHERQLQSLTPTRLLYDIDTFGGQSGSPIWRQVEGSPPVAVGIHTTGGVSGNSGTRIYEPVLDNLILWNEAP